MRYLKLSVILTRVFILALVIFPLFAVAALPSQQAPLPAAQAFQLTTEVTTDNVLIAHWQIAPGYYLYQDRFQFAIKEPKSAKFDQIMLPPGLPHQDEIFGKYQIYQQQVTIKIPIMNVTTKKATVVIHYQGCSDNGFCYPPVAKEFDLTLNDQIARQSTSGNAIDRLLASDNFLFITLGFFILGILLAFTPCVFPMLPILSSIIVGQNNNITTFKAFTLSLIYVLSMAITYAAAGLMVGLAGSNLQSTLQQPAIIIGFCILLICLAGSLFGLYELQLPAAWQAKITQLSNRQQGGTYVGAGIMGILSALVVSPCVSAPLVGALSYISQQGNPWLGGSTLLALGLGMGFPLLIIGTFGGSLLPKAGIWMETVKNLFGFIIIGLAVWMLERMLPVYITMWLWAILFIIAAIYLGALEPAPHSKARLWKSCCFILLMLGITIPFTDPSLPWYREWLAPKKSATVTAPLPFLTVKNLTELQHYLAQAKQQQQKVLLDFYADWCVNCKKMEQTTYRDDKVRTVLNQYLLLQVDMTTSNADIKALVQHFNVIAPPTIILFNFKGPNVKPQPLIGFLNADELRARLTAG